MIRFILRRDQGDGCPGNVFVTHETLDMDCPALEAMMLRGGSGPSGFDTTTLIGAEVRPSETASLAQKQKP